MLIQDTVAHVNMRHINVNITYTNTCFKTGIKNKGLIRILKIYQKYNINSCIILETKIIIM